MNNEFPIFSFFASKFAFFLRMFDEFFSGFFAKFQKILTCVAFSIKFAKINQKFAENSEFCENYIKLFTIFQNYSLHSLGEPRPVPRDRRVRRGPGHRLLPRGPRDRTPDHGGGALRGARVLLFMLERFYVCAC